MVRRRFAGASAALLLAAIGTAASASDQQLLLDVVVNGRATGKVGDFTQRDGVLLAREDDLRSLGLVAPPGSDTAPGGLLPLTMLSGVTTRIDVANQVLFISAADRSLVGASIVADGAAHAPHIAQSDVGATLNYDVIATTANGQAVTDGLLDLRLFSPQGVASTGLVVRMGDGYGYDTAHVVRLDTSYTISDVERLTRYRVGDFITGALDWTRPVRLGGVQVIRDFGLRPDLITFPVPSLSGSVTVPSTIDVLVNGARQLGADVDAGPFNIPQLPIVSGAGTVSTRITNALGEQALTTLPFYASASLLAPGLQAYSAQVGAVRRGWGVQSAAYGRLAATGAYRRGLTPNFTAEATAEATSGMAMVGGGGVFSVSNLMLVNFAGAASTSSSGTGGEVVLGVQHSGPRLTLAASAIIASRDFKDVAAVEHDAVPQRQLRATAAWSLGRFGSASLNYAEIFRRGYDRERDYIGAPLRADPLSLAPAYFVPVDRARLLSGSYSAQWRNLSLYATGFNDFNSRNAYGFSVGLTLPLGRRSSVTASVVDDAGEARTQVQANRAPISNGDWGYQMFASSGRGGRLLGEAQYRSDFAQLSAGVDHVAGRSAFRAGASGSLTWMDGGFFASNTIADSFAVVDTDGASNVRVRIENRDVGRTDAHGRLLVPDLRSYQANNVSIDPLDVRLDADVGEVARIVSPRDRSGVVVHFPIKSSRAAIIRLVDGAGQALPLGSVVRLASGGASAPVGYDGVAYVTGLKTDNLIHVEQPNGAQCDAWYRYAPTRDAIPTSKPLLCAKLRS